MATIQIESSTPLAENFERNRSNPPPKRYHHKRRRSCMQWWKILPPTYKFFLIVIILLVLLVVYLYVQKLVNYVRSSSDDGKNVQRYVPNPESPLPPSASILHQFKRGVVCSDSHECSKIGSDIFERDGNIFDVAIAVMLCNGISTAQSMGIGGGFLMNIWLHAENKSVTLNAKEVAPLAATKDMFKTPEEYLASPLSIGVPGEVKGYFELHKKYGKTPWKSLVEPSIKICEDGFKLSKHMSDFIRKRIKVKDSPLWKSFFINGTDTPRNPGELIHLPSELCNTYKILAVNGGNDFYTGTLADLIVDDLRDLGSIITKKDLESYESRWEESLSLRISNNDTVYVTPSAGGPIVAFILNILRGYNFTSKAIESDDERLHTYHRFIEAYKFAFGYRTQLNDSVSSESHLSLVRHMLSPELAEQIRRKINDSHTTNDPNYYGGQYEVVNDKGTSHISILAPNGDAISVTSSINYYFGIGQTGKRTGIIFNTGMNDFSVPGQKNQFGLSASPGNFIAPQKRPQSSMAPTIVADTNGTVRLAIGAAGGTKIPTGVSMVIARLIWFNQNIKEAVDAPRIHHQLVPTELQYEYGNTQKIITGLESLGHKTIRYADRGSVVCAIAQNSTGIYANADYRKAGDVVGF